MRLDRQRILDAATAIVAAEGMGALTMRRIGAELGADPTAIYRHFRDKRELLTELSDRLFSTTPELGADATWRERLEASTWHSLRRYRTHLDLGLLLAGQPDDLPSLVRIRENALEILTDAGLELDEAARFSHMLETVIVGCGLFFAVSGWNDDAVDPEQELAAMRRAYALLPAEDAPLAREAAPHLFPGPEEMFAQLIDLIADAIDRAADRPAEIHVHAHGATCE